jgi:predicted nucleotidyltransferase component of viral defense system
MDKHSIQIKEVQKNLLKAFAKKPGSFALTGGTALELYYLHHRFSADLDFFSPLYDRLEIDRIVSSFRKETKYSIRLENEFVAPNMAKVRFYYARGKKVKEAVKIDFVEDVIFRKPKIKKFTGVPVYDIENIYLQKISAITGSSIQEDDIGRQIQRGRQEARDAFDIYMLSKEIKPLSLFLKEMPRQLQRGMVHWYRTFSRQDIKLGFLELEIYVKKFDAQEAIRYLEGQMKEFLKGVLEE